MRMQCAYSGDDNTVAGLAVEHGVEGVWKPLDLGVTAPGFEIFVYAVFTCQHLYFRVNCAERGLLLDTATGSIEVGADADWNLDVLQVRFAGRLRGGRVSGDDIDYIVARMKQCPVSRNMCAVPGAVTTVILE
jgi:hypothetical protein